jgi:hypothetical protein
MKQYLPKPKLCICGCGKYFTPARIGQKWINKSHQIAWENNTPEGRAEKELKRVARLNRFRESISVKKEIPHHKGLDQQLQDLVNSIAKIIDYGQPCIATGVTFRHGDKATAGHYISVGANETIRYHLHNIHTQSFVSNGFNGGDPEGYKKGIVKAYGEEYLNYLESLKGTPVIKMTGDDILDKIASAKKIIQQLPARKVYTKEARILLRDTLNLRLGIYTNGMFKNYLRELQRDNQIVK